MAGLEVVKPVKDEFQADWGAAADMNMPQPEVADVSSLYHVLLVICTVQSSELCVCADLLSCYFTESQKMHRL